MPEPAEQQLTDRDRAILELERSRWKYTGAKETRVRERLDMSLTRYYQVLNALLDEPAALTHDPVLVRRLQRIRSQRRRVGRRVADGYTNGYSGGL